MRKIRRVPGIIVFMAIIGVLLAGCNAIDNVNVLSGTVTIVGNAEVGQTLTADVSALGGNGIITFQWARGGSISIGSNENTYIVQTADVGSTITVTVSRSGSVGNITSVPTAVVLSYFFVIFNSAIANGSLTQTTTELILIFNEIITNLSANDIYLSGISDIRKGELSGSGPIYTLPISGFTSSGELAVEVKKSGIDISNSSKTVDIYYATTAGVPLNIEQIIDGVPLFESITISRANTIYPVTWLVSVNASDYDTGSIRWELAGTGINSDPVTGSGPSFTLNATDERYNSLGGHILILTVIKNGMQYQRAIPFTIVQ